MVDEVPQEVSTPRYTYAEADRLANATRGTAKRWLTGYSYHRPGEQRRSRPPVTSGRADSAQVSFLDLVEVVAIGRLKASGLPLGQIRSVVRNCQELLGVTRPLVSLKLKVGGRDVFVEAGADVLEVGRKRGMLAWSKVLEPFLAELEYYDDWARRWWPLGRDKPVVVDPALGFGFPVVVGSGVRTEIVLERFLAGDLHDEIASDFNLDPVDVERALQFELRRAA